VGRATKSGRARARSIKKKWKRKKEPKKIWVHEGQEMATERPGVPIIAAEKTKWRKLETEEIPQRM